MYKLFYWIERIKEAFLLRYRKFAFLSSINSSEKSVVILGRVSAKRAQNVKIGRNVVIYPNVSFSGSGEIVIGDGVQLGEGSILYSHRKIFIGNNVAVAGQCYIIDCNHGTSVHQIMQEQELLFDEEGIFIGSDVWIGAGCKIIKGSRINDGAVIGALSLVNSEIPAYGIAFGIPAKLKRYRS